MNTKDDVVEFLEILKKWSDLSKNWNTAKPNDLNRLHNQYHKIFKKLRENDRLEELVPFIEHDDKIVSNVIATYCLLHNEEMAIKRLEQLSNESGLVGLAAKSNLNQWRKGELHFDY